jgi:GH15 family glucan-1,4-alpha-glucosidase
LFRDLGMRNLALRIEDYAIIGDLRTVALVGRDGSIDWLCLPSLDSPACFAALLGDEEHGRWLMAPTDPVLETRRRYRGDTLVLETEFRTATGRARVIDFMPTADEDDRSDLVRIVEGIEGEVAFRTELVLRFTYGQIVPWVRREADATIAVSGADAVRIETPVDLEGKDYRHVGTLTVRAGEKVPFTLCWYQSFGLAPRIADPLELLDETTAHWQRWADRFTDGWVHRDAVLRSLITLKALTNRDSGGIGAAATMSLPEKVGGERNWDYRYCWLRDATFTLYAFLLSGYREEAECWAQWLLRAAAGRPSQMSIMYRVTGERLDGERIADWLPGYEGSAPVRIGNGAHSQFQLDVFGEVFDVLHTARKHGLDLGPEAWHIQRALIRHVEQVWDQPDSGMWEIRGAPQHFTSSKTMAWVVFDRAIKGVEEFGFAGPVDAWRALRDRIQATVLKEAYNERVGAFVQTLGGELLDAAVLLMPLVGLVDAKDPRMIGTVDRIREKLGWHGFVRRYDTTGTEDGLPSGEGTFLMTSFWLADVLAMQDRAEEATELFERLLAVTNDVGLLAEEYDPVTKRQLGNFPQAFSHVGIVSTAHNLSRGDGPAQRRST